MKLTKPGYQINEDLEQADGQSIMLNKDAEGKRIYIVKLIQLLSLYIPERFHAASPNHYLHSV
jgi:hypothetical protein